MRRKAKASAAAFSDAVRELGGHVVLAIDPMAWTTKYPLGALAFAAFAGYRIGGAASVPGVPAVPSHETAPSGAESADSGAPGLWRTLSGIFVAELVAPLAVAGARKLKDELRDAWKNPSRKFETSQ